MNHGIIVYKGVIIFKNCALTDDFVLNIHELLAGSSSPSTTHREGAANQSEVPSQLLPLDGEGHHDHPLSAAPSVLLHHGVSGLDFWNCRLEGNQSACELLSDVIMVVSETMTLQKLFFSNNALSDGHLRTLCGGLIFLEDLRELRIVSNNLTHRALDILSEVLSKEGNTLKRTLRVLDLSDNPFLLEEHMTSSFQLFVCSALSNSNVSTLRLANIPGLSSQHIDILSQWICHSTCSLQHLDLSHNHFNMSLVQSLCSAINREDCALVSLELNHCQFSPESAEFLGQNLWRNHVLDKLSLNGMPLLPFMEFAKSTKEIRS